MLMTSTALLHFLLVICVKKGMALTWVIGSVLTGLQRTLMSTARKVGDVNEEVPVSGLLRPEAPVPQQLPALPGLEEGIRGIKSRHSGGILHPGTSAPEALAVYAVHQPAV